MRHPRHSLRLVQLLPDIKKIANPFCLFFLNFKIQIMLRWTITFLVIAVIAAILGFTGVAIAFAGIAKVIFFIFLVLFILSFFLGRKSAS